MKFDLPSIELRSFYQLASVLMLVMGVGNVVNYFFWPHNLWSAVVSWGGIAFNFLLAWLFFSLYKAMPDSKNANSLDGFLLGKDELAKVEAEFKKEVRE